jgi:ferredoxin
MDGYNKVAGDHPQPRLLVHDSHGRDMIAMAARFGDGLVANMLPIEIEAISSFGHAEALGALASGFGDVHILLSPTADQVAIGREVALATAIAGEHIHIIDTPDPDQMTAALSESKLNIIVETPILAMGSRRQVTRSAARALHGDDKILSLPEDAPYGAVLVDTDSCSMCLSCVSLCPSGALGENPDKPQLLFQEDACLQCGLCSNICPENAITYEPRLNLGTQALEQTVLNEEEPFACIECGALFGVKSSIERITEKLSSGVGAFANPDALKLVQMCGDCRVNAQFHSTDNPFAAKERPRVRTTADYYSDRDDH